MSLGHVDHTIEPVFDERSRVLLLGTMPSPASREAGFFYGNPHNRFWSVMAALFDEPVPETVADKRDLLLRHNIALWDVLASCDIEGASDASICNAQPNDLRRILNAAKIQAVFATGAKAGQLYRKLCEPSTGVPCVVLPSTSPANAKMRLDDLTRAYADALLPHLPQSEPRTLDVERVVELEQSIAAGGTPLSALMRRAGRSLAKATLDLYEGRHARAAEETEGPRPCIAVLCGSGNNGGDGWVAAEALAQDGCAVRIVTPRRAEDLSAEPARSAALHASTALAECADARILVAPDEGDLAAALDESDVVVDAILGTGFSGDEVRDPCASWIDAANARRRAGALAVAADVPSGLSAQTGKAADHCFKADLTVTMMVLKPGLATPYAFAYCGEVRVAPIAYIEPYLEKPADEKKGARESSDLHPAPRGGAPSAGGLNQEFLRAEAEDDDGYDPYSDRRPEPEPLFQRDPWE